MDFLQSSDSVRSARLLKHAQNFVSDIPLQLERGGILPAINITYETYGRLNKSGDNAILICHALSGDSHVAQHDADDDPGWWDIAVGPGKPIDTDLYYVICPNTLGGCRGTTGPNSVNPATGRRYGAEFPTITAGDIVEMQRILIDHLGINRLHSIIGGSMGGHQALIWATRYPLRITSVIVLATSARLTTQALAFNVVGRNAIRRDPNFKKGQYIDHCVTPAVGLALARMLGHITYLSPAAMREKFEPDRLKTREFDTEFEKQFNVGSYLAYQGDKFVERFDANSYIKLSLAMDLFELGKTPEEFASQLAQSQCRWLIISFTSDWLFPPEQSQEITNALLGLGKPVSYCNVVSSCGHDAFLLPDDLPVYGELIRAHLESAQNSRNTNSVEIKKEDSPYIESPASIFRMNGSHRLDYDQIVSLIQPEASVLDLGCGRGSLLAKLRSNGNGRLMGLELNEADVLSCLRQGLDVVQADLNSGLSAFAAEQFDYIVLSHTLQAVRDVERLIAEMLRVGRRSIISFPNFAYYKLRRMIGELGKSPMSSGLLCHQWYNTPNIRFFTITDFEEFCRERSIHIHERIAFDTEDDRLITEDVNYFADMALFVLSK
jgi:homoserine O-acetyltransferase/O-succinyltransferase